MRSLSWRRAGSRRPLEVALCVGVGARHVLVIYYHSVTYTDSCYRARSVVGRSFAAVCVAVDCVACTVYVVSPPKVVHADILCVHRVLPSASTASESIMLSILYTVKNQSTYSCTAVIDNV